jgi:hypothetical protein
MKIKDAIFNFKVGEGPNVSEMVRKLTQQQDFYDLLYSNQEEELTVRISSARNKFKDKESMFEYYHKVVLAGAIEVFSADGWEGMDKVKADYFLKEECAKGIIYNPKINKEVIYLEEKANMSRDRLYKFITDCITFLEVEKNARVPDSSSWRIQTKSGIGGFVKVK